MTRKFTDEEWKAIDELYGDHETIDLTPNGYNKALRLRRMSDPASAKRIERRLKSLTQEVFPRRGLDWSKTSVARHFRVTHMGLNPHLEADVSLIRGIIGAPEEEGCVQFDDVMVQAWISLHISGAFERGDVADREAPRPADLVPSQDTRDRAVPTLSPPPADILTPIMRERAWGSGSVDLRAASIPEWLRTPPTGPGQYDRPVVPLDWAVGRLIERHRLPWHLAKSLTYYVLTLDRRWVEGLQPFDIRVTLSTNTPEDPGAFRVEIDGLDEFVTKAQWTSFYARIRTQIAHLLELRGSTPQGKRGKDPKRLQTYLPLYGCLVKNGCSIKDLQTKRCQRCLSLVPGSSSGQDPDEETIRRAINDLDELLIPDSAHAAAHTRAHQVH